MEDNRVRKIAIVGGGTAGWMAAAMLARGLTGTGRTITVIESPDIGTVGVGEATIPPIIELLRFLGINEADFIRHTKATFKLGIKFKDWAGPGHEYWHPFGTFGSNVNRRPFFHYWHKMERQGAAPCFNDFSLCAALGDQHKFLFPDPAQGGPVAGLRYALHFDAGLVATYLRAYAEKQGVVRREGTVSRAHRREDGGIDRLEFAEGGALTAELYLDCSGFRGLLIEQCLATSYVDWTHYLPCDRAVALPTAAQASRQSYTLASARPAGWQWRIPLQHRTGNGYVYSSQAISDEAALQDLLAVTAQTPMAEPRFLRFVTGRRQKFWNHNCVALGLASGFLEPLESTSIHLVMSGVYNLLDHFPDRDFDPHLADSYNRELIRDFEEIRDFIILHYCRTGRKDTPLWRHCQEMPIPDSLAQRIDLYRNNGLVRPRAGELFTDLSWFYIFHGLGLRPQRHDPLVDVVPMPQLQQIFAELAGATRDALKRAPLHDSYFAGIGVTAA